MERIGVRELRQNASQHLARVARGETIEVTDRGRPIARLVPIAVDEWSELIASGRVAPPSGSEDIGHEAPSDYDVDASAVLAAMRALER